MHVIILTSAIANVAHLIHYIIMACLQSTPYDNNGQRYSHKYKIVSNFGIQLACALA